MKWRDVLPLSRLAATLPEARHTPVEAPPPLVPPDLSGWFPRARVCAVGGNVYVIAVASCSRCGAAVPIYDSGDYEQLRLHVEWHRGGVK